MFQVAHEKSGNGNDKFNCLNVQQSFSFHSVPAALIGNTLKK